jgi:nucleoporin NUP2
MRALASIVSLLTPFGSRQAKQSAAFGHPDADEEDDEREEDVQDDRQGLNDEDSRSTVEMDTLDDDTEGQESVYPPLPQKLASVPSQASSSSQQGEESGIKSPRQNVFTSSTFTEPVLSSSPRTGFGKLPASLPRTSLAGSASSFTFGRNSLHRESSKNAGSLPSYPRPSARQQITSPLAKNYDLLARFFAEKAQQEVHYAGAGEASSSASLIGGEPGGEDGGLTEIEVAGCMRLIEESLAQGKNSELERLRGDALERASLHRITPSFNDESRYNQGYMSRSPSLPLGATAGDMSAGFGMLSRPTSSVSVIV